MILCIGTTPTVQRTMTFARLEINAVNRARSVIESASGKSLNVARVLSTLGEPCVATGFVGGDTGKFIREDLDRAKIPHDFVEVKPHTRTCTTVVDEATGDVTELVEESKEVEPEAWPQLEKKIEHLLTSAKLLVLSGSLTPNAPEDFYAWCVEAGNARGIRAIVDASGEPLTNCLPSGPFVVKPNRSELKRTVGIDDLKEGVRSLVQSGASWVVITMGKEGSAVSDGTLLWNVKTPPVEAISAIGSGDAYAAGLAAGLFRGQPMPDAAKLGAACAAANTLIALPGHVRNADVEHLIRQISLRERQLSP